VTQPYIKPEKILEKLKLSLPLSVTLEDPLTRAPVSVAYENLHALLVIDANNLGFESQVIGNLYAEMARMERAAEYTAHVAKTRYAKWKSEKSDECRAKAKAKKPTVNEIEAYYRALPEYDEKSAAEARLLALARLFGDLKKAFDIKSKHLSDHHRAVAGYERVSRREDESPVDRMGEYASYQQLQDELIQGASASGGAEALRKRMGRGPAE
jgi:hypothetical protein